MKLSMNSRSLNQILISYHEARLSHAFLLETDNQEQCLKDLKKILCELSCEQEYNDQCSKCNLCNLIQTENLPSFVVIRPDGMNIRKSQILELKKRFSTKPIYSKYNVYVIMNAEKLNSASANTILKFLEEPEAGILGFFITNNKENALDTIKSRCQILSNFYHISASDDNNLNIAINLIKHIHLSKELTIDLAKTLLGNEFEKKDLQKVFQEMSKIYYYFYQLNFKQSLENLSYSEVSFLKKKSPAFLLDQLNLVLKLEEELNYNINLNLLIDRLVLESR